jgi:hypothetical protein
MRHDEIETLNELRSRYLAALITGLAQAGEVDVELAIDRAEALAMLDMQRRRDRSLDRPQIVDGRLVMRAECVCIYHHGTDDATSCPWMRPHCGLCGRDHEPTTHGRMRARTEECAECEARYRDDPPEEPQ